MYKYILLASTAAILSFSVLNTSNENRQIDSEGIASTTNQTWTLLATGDVMLGRTVNTQTFRKYKDVRWPYEKTMDLLNSADITFINLESPLVKNCPYTDIGMIFCGNLDHAEGLKYAGIDVASLANNHAFNYGEDGLQQTVESLESVDILPVGIDNPKYIDQSGIRIAFLAYNDVGCYGNSIACALEDRIETDLREAENNADVSIIMFHWGNEYTHNPSQRQIDLAHFSIDNGADLVLGNHPHWTQPEEWYKGKLIVYSHGNFIFDQMWSEETRKGWVGEYYFNGAELIDYKLIPVYIEDYGQPEMVD